MKFYLLLIPLLIALSACSSSNTKPDVEVEDRGVSADQPSSTDIDDSNVATSGAEQYSTSEIENLDPSDPNSLLSVRIIYFAYDSSEIRPEFRPAIEAHAAYLAQNPGTVITLEGHTDERASREYNLALGERRALAVKRQLALLGASLGQIRTVSYGEERPVNDGHDETAWSENRRVLIIY